MPPTIECPDCIGGRCFNNADETSNMYVDCPTCNASGFVDCEHPESENGVCNDCGGEVDWVARRFKETDND